MNAYKPDSADVRAGLADGVFNYLELNCIATRLWDLIEIEVPNALSSTGVDIAYAVGETLKTWLDANRDVIVQAVAAQLVAAPRRVTK